MSFGFSVGDFIAAGQLAFDLFNACKNASDDYAELGELCRAVNIAVEACRPYDPSTILRRQHVETISILASDCRTTLRRLQGLLARYQNISTIRNVGNKIGFVSAKQERIDIRARLQEHLSAINTFSNGVQMETLGLTMKLVWKIIESQTDGKSNPDLKSLIENPEKVEGLLRELGSESGTARDELEKNRDAVSKNLKETLDQGGISTISKTDPTRQNSNKESNRTGLGGFATPSVDMYNPMDIDWFSAGGWRWLNPVNIDASCLVRWVLPPPIIRYTKDDEFLCFLPEGWSITPTMIERDSKMEDAYYYTFNNLSCAPDNKPKVSRAYCVRNPFLSDADNKSTTWVSSGDPPTLTRKPTTRFFHRASPALQIPLFSKDLFSTSLGFGYYYDDIRNHYLECAGFFYNNLWLDLSDGVSQELARVEVSNGGKRQMYSEDLINENLHTNWTWDPDDSGNGRHTYIATDITNGKYSSVHPARFYDPLSDIPHNLPPKWDRRLDAWGNLFFVDHNTKSAVREDPRFNASIDSLTGLPRGWKTIQDHNDQTFYYRVHGQIILGTWTPSTMNDKSVKGKKILKAVPQDGDDPHLLDLNSRPRDRERLREKEKSVAQSEKRKIREMTPAESKHYYKLFAEAPKQDELLLSFSEAIAHCRAFKILPGVAAQILLDSDTNHDRFFDCDEYVTALHRIRVSMENEYMTKEMPPSTQEDREAYRHMFIRAKRPGELHLTLDEVMALCNSYELPPDLLERVWTKADVNHDKLYSPNEFVEGMHQILTEYQRREALCMNVNISTPKPLTPDSTQIRDTSSNLTIEHLPREVESLAISNASPKTENAGSVTDATNQET